MALRRRKASNRHWVFCKQEILAPLNDELALRHGAEYTLEVPESSFDWDVEFSVIKDRSGNTLREQYMAAWVQPSLIGPNDDIHQLGVRVHWKNPVTSAPSTKDKSQTKPQFNSSEVAALMQKIDEVLGSPLKTEEEEVEAEVAPVERPQSVTNQKTARILKAAKELAKDAIVEESAQKVFDAIKQINDAQALNSLDMQQVEVQGAYDKLEEMRSKPETVIIGMIGKAICDKMRGSDVVDIDLYDILSRLGRQITDSLTLSYRSPDFKLRAINDIETALMNILENQELNETLVGLLRNYESDFVEKLLSLAAKQVDALRDKALKLDLSDVPAPQVVEKYVEEIQENPPETP